MYGERDVRSYIGTSTNIGYINPLESKTEHGEMT